ncbi:MULTISPECIES: MATE family efflux transporter [unclassified Butyrivibrio]|uniref:MATE family efflux transporter n=1 Tax=unclassified Butyrivibrio TaxID=2639466 RepID=UPI0003F622E0|nr:MULTISPECIES: MATE family efflux transporter [unclassified Butyrivibrio]
MNEERDLTKGKPLSLILSFALSLIVGNIFQQLYIIVDNIIIGRKVGAEGLSAIGGTEWFIFLVNGFVIGLIQGFSVLLGNKYGEKDETAFSQYYKKAKAICFVLAISLVAILLSTSGFVLRALDTKEEVFSFAKIYVDVIFLGLPFLIFYQFFAAVLRSRGNSKIHLMAMTVSSLCNIVLDLLFVSVLNMGTGGAALGTILSECLVMIICGYNVYKNRQNISNVTPGKGAGSKDGFTVVKELMTIGLPMALQSVITAIGGLIVINRINQYELSFLTGYTIAGKIYVLLEIAASSYGLAVVAYVSQNMGARNYERIRSGVRVSVLLGIITALLCSAVMIIFGQPLMKLFMDAETANEAVFSYGYKYLQVLAAFFPLLYILYIVRSTLQGMGNSIIPMLSSFAQLIMRVSCALILTRFIGYYGIYFGEICAWALADCILIFTCFLSLRSVGELRVNE